MFSPTLTSLFLALLLVGTSLPAFSMGKSCRRLVQYQSVQPEVREIKVRGVQFDANLVGPRREELLAHMRNQLIHRKIVTIQYPREDALTAIFPHQPHVDNPPQLFMMKFIEVDQGHLWIQQLNTDTPRDTIHSFYQDVSGYLFPKSSTVYEIKAGFFTDFDLRVPSKNGSKIRVKHWLYMSEVMSAFYALTEGTVKETHPHSARSDWMRYSFVTAVSNRRFIKIIVDYDPRFRGGSSSLTLISAFPVSEETYREYLNAPKEFN